MKVSRFVTITGKDEYYFTIESEPGSDCAVSVKHLEQRLNESLSSYSLNTRDIFFTRLFLSDIENQYDLVRGSRLYSTISRAAVSIIGQPGLRGGSINMLCYCIKSHDSDCPPKEEAVHREEFRSHSLQGSHYHLHYNASVPASARDGVYDQTREILASIDGDLGEHSLSFDKHAIRSWIYVRDIDNHYAGMVRARKEFFASHNLTEKTRYLASTGIQGCPKGVSSLVSFDLLSIGGLSPEQIVKMECLSHMPRTIDYGVTFERGLRVDFGDRSHLYISGTASIDESGRVAFPGDIVGQTQRTLENTAALLRSEGAGIGDLAYLIVYVRDLQAIATVEALIRSVIPDHLPVLFMHAAVCRPAWLIEVEGVGIVEKKAPFPPFL